MRSMLVRAAEIRDSEQQQIFDALDEIHARLAPLESLGSVRKRLSEMPDRTEVSVLAERVDEALSKLEAQDSAIAALDHHLDQQDARLDGLPAAVHGPVREQIGATETGLRNRLDELDKGAQESLSGALESLSGALESVTQRLDVLSSRLDTLDGALAHRPDVDTLLGLVRRANEESELRYTAQLDEVMATFAEIIMGGGAPASVPPTPPPPPRPAQRRVRRPAKAAQDSDDAPESVGS
jgi:chromosome segregation ATPase